MEGLSAGTYFSAFAALAVAGVTSFFYAAAWSGRVHDRWYQRVEMTHAGLTVRAQEQLLRLHGEIETMLGVRGGQFDPISVTVDPSPFVRQAHRLARMIKVRDTLKRDFKRYRGLRVPAVASSVLLLLASAILGIHMGGLYSTSFMRILGFCAGGAGVLLGVVIASCYFYFEGRLADAEMLAAPDDER